MDRVTRRYVTSALVGALSFSAGSLTADAAGVTPRAGAGPTGAVTPERSSFPPNTAPVADNQENTQPDAAVTRPSNRGKTNGLNKGTNSGANSDVNAPRGLGPQVGR
jgi:hypothetical protein